MLDTYDIIKGIYDEMRRKDLAKPKTPGRYCAAVVSARRRNDKRRPIASFFSWWDCKFYMGNTHQFILATAKSLGYRFEIVNHVKAIGGYIRCYDPRGVFIGASHDLTFSGYIVMVVASSMYREYGISTPGMMTV